MLEIDNRTATPTCSVVIPTWNEEAWLPHLLATISTYPCVGEVLVADNDSHDMTCEVARRFGCRVTSGGTPAQARNCGAKMARHDIMVFVDADTLVPWRTLQRAIATIATDQADVYHCRVVPLSRASLVKFCYSAMDWWFRALRHIGIQQGVGNFIAIRRTAFFRIGGFRECILAGEDADFFRRAARVARVSYDPATIVYTSDRRMRLEYPVRFISKTVFWALLRLTATSASVFPYRWVSYPSQYAIDDAPLYQQAINDYCDLSEVTNG
jgi:glycosyltransferase involved in cell wall biosynthesis